MKEGPKWLDGQCFTAAILDSISEGVFTVDHGFRVTSFNRAAEDITGVPRSEALGRPCFEVFKASLCESGCALRHTLKSGRPLVERAAYIVDVKGRRLPISVSTALLKDARGRVVGGAETFRDLSLVEELRRELKGQAQVEGLVSRSPAMKAVFETLPRLAQSESTVLILGETGTGKELAARALHARSARSKGPFVAVNCAAIPEPLLESELFGTRAGAFTGARDKPGRLAQARGGTLFLDEIGDLGPSLQAKLLRVLQEKTFEPLGSNLPQRLDARVLAATHRDLPAMVQAGTFRQDLYYRVNVLRLLLPPLRRRREDIGLLAAHFLERLRRLQGGEARALSPQALGLLEAHDWPGNVRELENVLERAFALCPRGDILPLHLPEEFRGRPPGRDPTAYRQGLDEARQEAVRAAILASKGNRTAAARRLGMHKTTLHRILKRMPSPPPTGPSKDQ